MQEPDLRHLVEGIWAGQSALSAEKDLFELVLVRWNNSIQWSPWNTVCLTRDEAKAHCKLSNVYEVSHCCMVVVCSNVPHTFPTGLWL